MTKPKDWTRDIVRRFKEGASVAELADMFHALRIRDIEGIIRQAMQQQEEDF